MKFATLKLVVMLSANFKLKRTAAASRGFLATARLSCSTLSTHRGEDPAKKYPEYVSVRKSVHPPKDQDSDSPPPAGLAELNGSDTEPTFSVKFHRVCIRAKLHYTYTGYERQRTNTTNGQKFATSQHLDMSRNSRCWALALRCGKFVVASLSVGGLRSRCS